MTANGINSYVISVEVKTSLMVEIIKKALQDQPSTYTGSL